MNFAVLFQESLDFEFVAELVHAIGVVTGQQPFGKGLRLDFGGTARRFGRCTFCDKTKAKGVIEGLFKGGMPHPGLGFQ